MKYKNEPCITQMARKSGMAFYVRIRNEHGSASKMFNEKDFPSTKIAFETAKNWRNKMLVELAQGTVIRASKATVADMFDYYLRHTTASAKTKENHTSLYNKWNNHKQVRIQELTKAMIVEDLNKMVETCSDDMISKSFTVWKDDIIGSALLQEIIIKDVTLGIKKPKSHVIKTTRDVTTDRETLQKIEDGIHKYVSSEYDAKLIVCLLELLYYTGMRPAEAEVLTKADIHKDYISINKELGSSMSRSFVVRRCKTENSVRNVPIHPNLKPILDDLINYALEDELFIRENGRYLSSKFVGNAIRRLCKKEGLEFNLYRLRHNMATSLVTNKVDTRTTMELLGHANYDMSIYYATSNEELKEEAINLVS